MTPTKLLLGQIAIVLVIVIGGVWAATQWAAAMLGYQARLGVPWSQLGGVPLYEPWALFAWWYHYEAYAPQVFDKAGLLAGASGFLGCGASIAGSLWRARQSRHVTTYGSARWARPAEVAKAGLLANRGVVLGLHRRRYLQHEGPEHVMAFAPTRSGKGVGLVIPTLLAWLDSAVVHDIKGENWRLTAGWRSKFSHCLMFNPTDARSARYNPLLEVRRGPDEVADVQNIADILVDPVVTTDRRTYHLQLTSRAAAPAVAVSWTYPADALLALRAPGGASPARPQAGVLAVSLDRLRFDYALSGDKPAWRPLRVFDDGRQTYIEFPPSLAVGQAPPLFLVGSDGGSELVNYRLVGRHYVVDRLFDAAELRLGARKPQVVRIRRAGAGKPAKEKGQ